MHNFHTVFFNGVFFARAWEIRKIEDEMKKQRERQRTQRERERERSDAYTCLKAKTLVDCLLNSVSFLSFPSNSSWPFLHQEKQLLPWVWKHGLRSYSGNWHNRSKVALKLRRGSNDLSLLGFYILYLLLGSVCALKCSSLSGLPYIDIIIDSLEIEFFLSAIDNHKVYSAFLPLVLYK